MTKSSFFKAFLLCSIFCYQLPSFAQIDQQAVDDFTRNFAYTQKRPLAEIEGILAQAKFQPSIIETMERPAEKTMTWERYRNIFLKDDRINAGVKFWQQHQAIIDDVSAQTGVAPEIIVGIIGVETFYGQRAGSHRVLDALYTLAFGYPKRSSYFKSELGKFIELVEKENLDVTSIKGSYAGAMGYCQFMPSSYLAYAKSYDGQGGIDLMNNVEDAIISVANYIEVHRWRTGESIATRAKVTVNAQTLKEQSVRPKNNYETYKSLGYVTGDGSTIQGDVTLLEFTHEDGSSEFWFCLDNFYVITRYNHSPLYALAVYQLGQAVKSQRKTH